MIIKRFKLFESQASDAEILQTVEDICLEISDYGLPIKTVKEKTGRGLGNLFNYHRIIIGIKEDNVNDIDYSDYDDDDFDLIDDDDDDHELQNNTGLDYEDWLKNKDSKDLLVNSKDMTEFLSRLYEYLNSVGYYLKVVLGDDQFGHTLIEAGYPFSGLNDFFLKNDFPIGRNINDFENLNYMQIIFWPKNGDIKFNERLSPSTYYNAGVKLKAKKHTERGDILIKRAIELDNKNTLDFTIVTNDVHDIKARFSHFEVYLIADNIDNEFRTWKKGEAYVENSHQSENAIKIYVEPIFINLDSEVKSQKFCPFILTFMIFGRYYPNKDLEDLLNFEIKIEPNIDFSKDSPTTSEWGYGVITDRKSAVKLRNIILNIKSNSEFLDYAEEIISNNAHLDLDTYEKFLTNIDKIKVNNLYIPYDSEWDEYSGANDITK